MEKYNVFVYGTLMQGHANHERFFKGLNPIKAVLTGYRRIWPNHTFPIIVEDKKSYVSGEIYSVSKEQLKDLDILEGVPTLYKRITVFVSVDNEPVQTFVYYPNNSLKVRYLSYEEEEKNSEFVCNECKERFDIEGDDYLDIECPECGSADIYVASFFGV